MVVPRCSRGKPGYPECCHPFQIRLATCNARQPPLAAPSTCEENTKNLKRLPQTKNNQRSANERDHVNAAARGTSATLQVDIRVCPEDLVEAFNVDFILSALL